MIMTDYFDFEPVNLIGSSNQPEGCLILKPDAKAVLRFPRWNFEITLIKPYPFFQNGIPSPGRRLTDVDSGSVPVVKITNWLIFAYGVSIKGPNNVTISLLTSVPFNKTLDRIREDNLSSPINIVYNYLSKIDRDKKLGKFADDPQLLVLSDTQFRKTFKIKVLYFVQCALLIHGERNYLLPRDGKISIPGFSPNEPVVVMRLPPSVGDEIRLKLKQMDDKGNFVYPDPVSPTEGSFISLIQKGDVNMSETDLTSLATKTENKSTTNELKGYLVNFVKSYQLQPNKIISADKFNMHMDIIANKVQPWELVLHESTVEEQMKALAKIIEPKNLEKIFADYPQLRKLIPRATAYSISEAKTSETKILEEKAQEKSQPVIDSLIEDIISSTEQEFKATQTVPENQIPQDILQDLDKLLQ